MKSSAIDVDNFVAQAPEVIRLIGEVIMKHALRLLHMWKDLSGCLAILWDFTPEWRSNHAKLLCYLTEGALPTLMKSSSF